MNLPQRFKPQICSNSIFWIDPEQFVNFHVANRTVKSSGEIQEISKKVITSQRKAIISRRNQSSEIQVSNTLEVILHNIT